MPFIILQKIENWLNRLQGKGYGTATTAQEVRQVLKFFPEPKLVIDVGGNIGSWSEALLEQTSPEQLIIVEPAKSNISKLKERFSKKEIVTIVNAALTDHIGYSTLYSNTDGSGLASLYQRRLDHFQLQHIPIETVQTITFDELLKDTKLKYPDIIKLDIEGHEFTVLKSIPQHILDEVKVIQFEFGGCNIDSRTYFQDFWYLLHNSFLFFRITPFGTIPILTYSELDEVFTTTNYICVNKKIGLN